MISMVSIVSEV